MHHLPPFCKCLYPQERCIDKQQTVACCRKITSRQPVYCSRLQQVSRLASLVLFVKSPVLKNGHSLRTFTKRVLRIYRESTRSETRGKIRKRVIRTVPAPVQTVRLLLLLRPSPSTQISRATNATSTQVFLGFPVSKSKC